MKKNSGPTNKVRIIAGHWRSRQVQVIDQKDLRPTTDRVRETLFNWINPLLQGSACLDLFAGTGVLGLEAASRGAKLVQFVEQGPKAYINIKNNLEMLQPGPSACQIEVTRADAIYWLGRHDASIFDIIFVDPPFDDVNLLQNSLKTLGKVQFQTKSPIIYVESTTKIENEVILENLQDWQIDRQLIAGAVKASLLKKK
ncbi:16S rRNA (guanine(966)-N(2))-methyltransferase RsmD [Polynucleobacter kasalickyi]|uniref:16S rRNA m(2)G-966 methyltransferase n=1 Tax=Polynucleobacter kasalickyi TaxID=1938817 RepID=A0A1W2ARH2_9BURK|nr:16S rRNA (guanine(966)-N(2))-methyltransferase RsmD [Polynucleobacter kasalickyi]SMC63041.1 16S rRNA m(2)G-966 methyltransferase [Polynucleobacter kasalickyi]